MPDSIELVQRPLPPDTFNAPDLDPLLARIYSARGLSDPTQIDYSLHNLLRPENISHLQDGAALLARHVEQGNNILIFGDYDADGATSTALCIRALRMLAHSANDFMLPDRLVDGYGLSLPVAERIVTANPDLVVTVDTGIASLRGIARLREAGIEVLVTDHHLPGGQMPDASCVVNPNAFADSKGQCLAGVGVAFYLMLALRSELRKRGWFVKYMEPNLADCLDLVSIGTVADLVPLDDNNRILVQEGILRIRRGACAPAISHLIELAGRNRDVLSSQDIAFAIAPRINAAGRLDDMRHGVLALLEANPERAAQLAAELNRINAYRRELQGEMSAQAEAILDGIDTSEQRDTLGRVLFNPQWHEGIVGIIASRVKDRSYRPSICFAASGEDQLKGSCRSISGVHIRDVLDLVDKASPGIILKFGGHAMAAGLSIRTAALDHFREAFEIALAQHADPDVFTNRVFHDGELTAAQLSLETARNLENAGPWGQRFPFPSFVGKFKVLDQRIVGERHVRYVLKSGRDEQSIDAISFYASPEELEGQAERLSIHYELSVNRFRDRESPQLIIRHLLAM